mgnify:CR=1 FL=1
MSFFTMVMTIPQVLTIWLSHQAAGVSLLSWSAYLISAVIWFWFGIQKHDKNIYLPCVGWFELIFNRIKSDPKLDRRNFASRLDSIGESSREARAAALQKLD